MRRRRYESPYDLLFGYTRADSHYITEGGVARQSIDWQPGHYLLRDFQRDGTTPVLKGRCSRPNPASPRSQVYTLHSRPSGRRLFSLTIAEEHVRSYQYPYWNESRALQSPGSRRGKSAHSRVTRQCHACASSQFREVALLRGASGSCRRGLHYPDLSSEYIVGLQELAP